MTHLQRALTGDAKNAVGGMLNPGQFYRAALTELEEQFGNEETVATKTILDCCGRSTTPYTSQFVR